MSRELNDSGCIWGDQVDKLLIALLVVFWSALAWAQSGKEEPACLLSTTFYCNNFEDYPTGTVGPGTPNESLTGFKNPGLPAGLGQNPNDFEIISSTNEPANVFSGTRALKWNYPAFNCPGDSLASGCGIGFLNPVWAGGARRELYYRLYHKWSSNFVFSGTATKGIDMDSPGLQTWYWMLQHTAFPCAGGLCIINQKTDTVYGANVNGGNFGLPTLNQWYCFEFHARDSSTPGVADGLMEMWVGVPPNFTPIQRWSYPNIVTANSGASSDWMTDFLYAGFWNGTNGQPIFHPAMNRWADNVIISTARIGCDIGSPTVNPPGTPSGLTVTKVRISEWARRAIGGR